MIARKWLAFGAGVLIAITVALVLGVIALMLLGIWGNPDLSDQYVATAFVLAFTAIATGGAAGFMVVAVDI